MGKGRGGIEAGYGEPLPSGAHGPPGRARSGGPAGAGACAGRATA